MSAKFKDVVIHTPKRTNASITKKVKKLKHLQDQIKTLKAVEKSLVDDIKDYIAFYDELQGVNGETLVTYKPYQASRFETKLFKEDEPELYERYLYKFQTRKFLVK